MSAEALRLRLLNQLMQLPEERLSEVEAFLARPAAPSIEKVAPTLVVPHNDAPRENDWPHAPLHRISKFGTYLVTTGTLHKEHLLRGPEKLDCVQNELLRHTHETGWQLEAWAIFSNHYHFVAHALEGAVELGTMLKEFHRLTAVRVNRMDDVAGRPVWYNFRDTELTYETSYYARLAYVHSNPVKHGLVTNARLYRWCSAGWFERTATPAQVATLASFKTDTVVVYDEYEPV